MNQQPRFSGTGVEEDVPLEFAADLPPCAFVAFDVIARPEHLFVGERLEIPDENILDFTIADLLVHEDSRFTHRAGGKPQAMPAECFSVVSVLRLRLDTCEPGNKITLRVLNRSSRIRRFRATLYGSMIR